MKKLLLPLLATVATLKGAAANSSSFTGFYLGGHLGGIQHQIETHFPSILWTANVKDSALNRT